MRPPWVTSTDFPPNPVLLTSEATSGIGHSLPLQGYPAPSANLVFFRRLFRVLPSHPLHLPSRAKHYASAMYFRHLAVYWRLPLLSRLRCQAHKGLFAARSSRREQPFASLIAYFAGSSFTIRPNASPIGVTGRPSSFSKSPLSNSSAPSRMPA